MLNFTKMNGAGNDFVLIDNRNGQLQLESKVIERLCDRNRGVGADGLLMVEPAENGADFRMRYYNRDGGEAEMCGNGARCFARFAQRLTGGGSQVSFETMAGVITANLIEENVELAMSQPTDLRLNQQIDVEGEIIPVHSVNTGVPHAVVVTDDLDGVEIRKLGAAIRHHSHFAPKGTNVNFIQPLDSSSIRIRTYERGVEDETLACGTGVVASALVFHELTGAASPVSVRVKGGDLLKVSFEKNGDRFGNVRLTGPADFVFDGTIEL